MRMLLAFAAVAGFLLSSATAQTTANWHDPELLRRGVEGYFQARPFVGLTTVCRAFSLFKDCLGPANYAACIYVPAFVESNIKPKPAFEYVKIFTQFHFTCGAGFNTFLNNECMATTWATQNQTLTNCRHQFDSDSDRDPRNACLFARDATQCYETQFLLGCPNSPDPGWWACEYERIGTAVMFPQCSLRCALPAAGSIGK